MSYLLGQKEVQENGRSKVLKNTRFWYLSEGFFLIFRNGIVVLQRVIRLFLNMRLWLWWRLWSYLRPLLCVSVDEDRIKVIMNLNRIFNRDVTRKNPHFVLKSTFENLNFHKKTGILKNPILFML